MNNENQIPCLDNPKDSMFKNNKELINLTNFFAYSNDSVNKLILTHLKNKQIWEISKNFTKKQDIYIEHGYSSSYFITKVNNKTNYSIIYIKDDLYNRAFKINLSIGGLYNYRGNDNYSFELELIDSLIIKKTNLNLEVLTDFNGNGIFGNYIYLDTPKKYSFLRQVDEPLTAERVREEISKGNYELYIYDGYTTYKIGNNLYIPRYNSYVYIGTININGMVINLKNEYYRFKFKII